ncbi:hypothetical protein SPRG_17909, partial [Saprolegnia parasitica CBS 223.65]
SQKTEHPRSAAAQDASSEPMYSPAEAAKATTSSAPAPAAAQAVPAAAQAATSDQVSVDAATGRAINMDRIDSSSDAKPSAWFPAPDLTSNFLDDEEAFDKAMRHNIKFTMADAREICGELQPPDFREALGPLADLRRKIGTDFQFRIPGPPVDENDGITPGAPSQQE